ncbi:hypothetical protein [Mesorhizobium sp. M7A.F.Ca.CA.002.12.1.1]|uniref:hypothetical protein n=1 Tax=Mesorhizobium sp. M7A.F.Ca.CA.002.12.1.1 TaxID=2496735 RepID=UPI000FCB2420|nr:hypothetical protein [Mesorhizobium sp. M7A.F.Ca.CA.002.12.1.1]RUX60191.1 hypothetical protein EN989_11295 [Mesorhizobium sp. M7A.F.Ca.CA.002.12.1.1]
MPKFKVTKCQDAFQHYSTIVEAENAEDAIEVAKSDDGSLVWADDGVSVYDETDWDNIPPELIP